MGKKKSVILTIDDEIVIRGSIRAYLEDAGYEVLEAENGKSGLEIVEERDLDLVLVDLRMPVMNGLEFLQKIKEKGIELPTIVVSGTGDIGDVVEALRHGAWEYLLKPIDDMSILVYAIEKCLERARLISENKKYQEDLEELVEQKTQELSLVNTRLKEVVETSKKLIGCGEMNLSGSIILKAFGDLMAATGGSFYKVSEKGLELLYSLDPGNTKDWIPFPLQEGSVFEKIMAKGEALYVKDISEEETLRSSGKRYNDNSFLAFPFPDDRGGISAILALHNKREPPFLAQDREIGAILSSFVSEVLQKAQVSAALKKSENYLRQAQKMEAIGTLAGGIAHDFNNILAAIIGYTDLSLYAESCSGTLRRNLEQVHKASNRAKDLVGQILAFSRTEEFKDDAVDIGPVIVEALKLLRATIPTSIEIQQNIPEGLGKVFTDPTKIYQVLMNLCTNAAHAMKNREGVLKVVYSQVPFSECPLLADDSSNSICLKLTVSDTGDGMEPEVMSRIFDPYFTTKEKGDGTGLGLAVVHGIVRSSGGEITVESEPGNGSSFHLYFPSISDGKVLPEVQVSGKMPRGTERVLFVDDETTLAEMAGQMLEKLGYTVVVLSNSNDALQLFSSMPEKFDLLITDQTMPELSGLDLARKILDIRPQLPVILYTGYSSAIDGKEIEKIGIRHYLMKPLSMGNLAEVVRRILDE